MDKHLAPVAWGLVRDSDELMVETRIGKPWPCAVGYHWIELYAAPGQERVADALAKVKIEAEDMITNDPEWTPGDTIATGMLQAIARIEDLLGLATPHHEERK